MFVAINAIEVPRQRTDEFAERFANRAGLVSASEGFVRFELLRPADGGTRWLVSTHWRSKEDFERWLGSQSFERGHGHGDGGERRGPVGTASELWRFEVVEQEE